MQRISSSNFPLTRLLVPLLPDIKRRSVQMALIGLVAVLWIIGLWMLLLPPLMAVALVLAIHHSPNWVFQNFCEDVWMDESAFLLQRQGKGVQVPFIQVQEITWHGSNSPPRAKIWLKSAGEFGSAFTFVPDLTAGRERARKSIDRLNAMVVGPVATSGATRDGDPTPSAARVDAVTATDFADR